MSSISKREKLPPRIIVMAPLNWMPILPLAILVFYAAKSAGVKGVTVKARVIDQSLSESSLFQSSSWPNCPSAVLILLFSSFIELSLSTDRLPSWANVGHKFFAALNRC